MRSTKKHIILLCILIAVVLIGIGISIKINVADKTTDSAADDVSLDSSLDEDITATEFQKNMNNSSSLYINGICETADGYYIQYNVYLYYIDKETNKVSIVCAKAECEHNDETCNAYTYGYSLCYYGGKLFYVDFSGDDQLYSMELDGTGRSAVQNIEHTVESYTGGNPDSAILNLGRLYYVDKGILYTSLLGENIDDAQAIYGDEVDYSDAWNVYEPTYKLWADGNMMYFMVDVAQKDGTYKDTLFSYNPETDELSQIWEVPEKSEVGEWETTGVSVSKWYITDGYLYYYLSGGDFWRADLATGKNEIVAETSQQTVSGTAVFSDDYMCLLNDSPDSDTWEGTPNHAGGDTIYLYGLDGEYLNNISLESLYQIGDIESFELLFCSDEAIYFLADATTWTRVSSTQEDANTNVLLCSADIKTGEITQLYAFDFA